MTGTKRFDRYQRLVDISFYLFIALNLFFYGLTFLTHVLKFDIDLLSVPRRADLFVYYALYYPNILLMNFLVIARFMRDEYAEQIWHRTAIVMMYILGIVPIVIGLLLATFQYDIADSMRAAVPPIIDRTGTDGFVSQKFSELEGKLILLVDFIMFAPFVFFSVYKIFRWREEH